MPGRASGDPSSEPRRDGETAGSPRSMLGRMLRLAAVLLVLALAAMAFVAADQYTIPFEYEGFD